MGTIADKLEYLLDTKTAIKNAITAKGVEVDNNATFRSYADSIESISGGGASVEPKDVNFYDYDGTLLYSYTIEEAQALEELPPLPKQDRLICQSWNWTLTDIKAFGREVNVGATYITDDSKTRIYISLSTEDELNFSLKLFQSAANSATVDWGDGSEPSSYSDASNTFYANHVYPSFGDYCIEIEVEDGELLKFTAISSMLNGLCETPKVVRAINFGSNISIYTYAFNYCSFLKNVTIPNGVTSIGAYAFSCCTALESVTVPNGATSFGNNTFNYCTGLKSVAIPNSVTSIGSYAFNYCTALKRVTIPSNVTSIGMYTFYYCTALERVTIPNSVTSLAHDAFNYCTALESLTIPSSVTSIGNSAFTRGYFRYSYHFKSTTPPALAGISAFDYITSYCIIYVPMESVDAYKTAPYWSTYASKIVGE